MSNYLQMWDNGSTCILPGYLKIPSAELPRNLNQAYHFKARFSKHRLANNPQKAKNVRF